jgi:predicted RNase H-like HicB family nuclease
MEQTRYEILVRRDGENKYSAFCPELNILVKGTSHEGVEMEIRKRIQEIMQQKKLPDNEVPKK